MGSVTSRVVGFLAALAITAVFVAALAVSSARVSVPPASPSELTVTLAESRRASNQCAALDRPIPVQTPDAETPCLGRAQVTSRKRT